MGGTAMTNLREWEHNHETTEHFAFTGGTEMTSQDELRDRMAEIVNAALGAWNSDRDTPYSEGEYTAQAIIDEFGLTVEAHAATHSSRTMTRIISTWEWGNQ